MINPIPPNPIRITRRIRDFIMYRSDAVQRDDFFRVYFQFTIPHEKFEDGIKDDGQNKCTKDKFPLYIENFINDEDKDIENFINLEGTSAQ